MGGPSGIRRRKHVFFRRFYKVEQHVLLAIVIHWAMVGEYKANRQMGLPTRQGPLKTPPEAIVERYKS
jgi:hypothetical protein